MWSTTVQHYTNKYSVSPTNKSVICVKVKVFSGSVVAGYTLGKLIIEGKTKQVWEISNSPDEVLVLSKDRITAGDGVKSHELKGKAEISNKSNGKVFELLNGVGESYIIL